MKISGYWIIISIILYSLCMLYLGYKQGIYTADQRVQLKVKQTETVRKKSDEDISKLPPNQRCLRLGGRLSEYGECL